MNQKKSGFTERNLTNKPILEFDGKPIHSFRKKLNNFGTYVVGDKIYNNGNLLIDSANTKASINVINDTPKSDGKALSAGYECINITLSNYNKLLNREVVAGYKPFNLYDVYNIVPDVATAPTISYSRYSNFLVFDGDVVWPKTEGVLYNNVIGMSNINTENYENTVIDLDIPTLLINYFDPVIKVGDKISVPLFIDDLYQNAIKHNTITSSFTIVIELTQTINGTTSTSTTSKTVYPGFTLIDTPVFSVAGETYFVIKAINERGACSQEHYMRVLVKNNEVWNFYEPSEAVLLSYDITVDMSPLSNPSDEDILKAYKNKKGLTKLFSDAKNGLIDGTHYSGVRLPTHTYYVIEYANISNTPGEIDLGGIYYYCVTLDSSKKVISYVERTEDQVYNDYDEAFRYEDSEHYGQIIKKLDETWNSLSSTVRNELDTQLKYLHTINANPLDYYGTNNTVNRPANRKYYFKQCTRTAGEQITLPSNFTLDLNGSTLKTANQYGLNDNLGNVYMFTLAYNVNTHIINGSIHGSYESYDWLRQCLARSMANPNEQDHMFTVNGSGFCSLKNIDFAYSLGHAVSVSHGRVYVDTILKKLNGDTTTEVGGYGYPEINENKRILLKDELIGGVQYHRGDIVDSYNDCVTIVTSYHHIREDRTTGDYLFFGRTGDKDYYNIGTRYTVFLAFYTQAGVLIDIIKTKHYWLVKIPNNAYKVRAMAYGPKYNGNNPLTYWNTTANGMLGFVQVAGTRGMKYTDMIVHDTRTDVFPADQNQALYKNIEFKNVCNYNMLMAHGTGNWDRITPLIIDFENSAQLSKYVTFDNCTVVIDNGVNAVSGMKIFKSEHLQLTNNRGFTTTFQNGVESMYVENNIFTSFYFSVSAKSRNPHLILINNYIKNNRFSCGFTDFGENPTEYPNPVDKIVPVMLSKADTWNPSLNLKCRQTFNGEYYID